MNIIIIEATSTGAGLRIIETAVKELHEVFFITTDINKYKNDIKFKSVTNKINIISVKKLGFEDVDQVVAKINENIILDGIVSITDSGIEVAAEIAQKYNLISPSYSSIKLLRSKYATKHLALKNNVKTAQFLKIDNLEQLNSFADEYGFPLILKSSIGTGSSQVRLCLNIEDLYDIYKIIKEAADKQNGVVLAEQYILGPLYSVECFIKDGLINFLGITDRDLGKPPFFVEEAYTFPISLEKNIENELYLITEKILKAANFDNGFAHAEFILSKDGAYLIEVNPRLAGGLLGPMISLSYDFDLYKELINLYTGKPVSIPPEPVMGASTVVIYPNSTGEISQIDKSKAVICPGVMEVKINAVTNQVMKPAIDFRGDVGYVLACGDNASHARSNSKTAANNVQYKIR
ncbi:ATP-grasp domain-containing protein [Shouchella sp. 1P09AA]|uniref:ATP-grasp domain-containing protein n=1 Tax=unclassified Shouchella TaxID=2893065 RepID=UPI0039A00720